MTAGRLAVAGLPLPNEALRCICAEIDLSVEHVARFEDAREFLQRKPPLCVLVDSTTALGQETGRGMRLSSQLSDVPLLAAVHRPWSCETGEAYALGVDDFVVVHHLAQLKQKLLALRTEGVPQGAFLSGKVVVADPDRERRAHLARHLRKMGLQVEFAADAWGIPAVAEVKLVVASSEISPRGAVSAFMEHRAGGGARIPWIISGAKAAIDRAREELTGVSDLSFVDAVADPVQIVSAANQLLIGSGRSMRRSPRFTFETPVSFAPLAGGHPAACSDGSDGDHGLLQWGYSYNISRGGLFVRTVTPPGMGQELALEFSPPFGRGRVIVEGKVAWRQEFSRSRGFPPGFGLQYAEDLPIPDAAALEAGYAKLLADNGNPAP